MNNNTGINSLLGSSEDEENPIIPPDEITWDIQDPKTNDYPLQDAYTDYGLFSNSNPTTSILRFSDNSLRLSIDKNKINEVAIFNVYGQPITIPYENKPDGSLLVWVPIAYGYTLEFKPLNDTHQTSLRYELLQVPQTDPKDPNIHPYLKRVKTEEATQDTIESLYTPAAIKRFTEQNGPMVIQSSAKAYGTQTLHLNRGPNPAQLKDPKTSRTEQIEIQVVKEDKSMRVWAKSPTDITNPNSIYLHETKNSETKVISKTDPTRIKPFDIIFFGRTAYFMVPLINKEGERYCRLVGIPTPENKTYETQDTYINDVLAPFMNRLRELDQTSLKKTLAEIETATKEHTHTIVSNN